MKITFGKFNGWDTLDLAKAGGEGRGYLEWGKDNLKSPQLRKAFADALKADVHADEQLIYQALRVSYSDIEIEEMEQLAREQAIDYEEDEARYERYTRAINAVVEKHAAILEQPEKQLFDWAKRYANQEYDDGKGNGVRPYSESNFSSHDKFMKFDAFIKEYESVEYK